MPCQSGPLRGGGKIKPEDGAIESRVRRSFADDQRTNSHPDLPGPRHLGPVGVPEADKAIVRHADQRAASAGRRDGQAPAVVGSDPAAALVGQIPDQHLAVVGAAEHPAARQSGHRTYLVGMPAQDRGLTGVNVNCDHAAVAGAEDSDRPVSGRRQA
jgi:hypothetical protein